jgi:hypothetical protein
VQSHTWDNARAFFNHYLDDTGTDLRFDAIAPHQQQSSGFVLAVDSAVHDQISAATALGLTSFTSGPRS